MVAVDQQQWTGPDGILGKLRNILVYSIYLRFSGKSRLAEREGFEPSIRFCRILTFQASAFDHSATAPHALERAAM